VPICKWLSAAIPLSSGYLTTQSFDEIFENMFFRSARSVQNHVNTKLSVFYIIYAPPELKKDEPEFLLVQVPLVLARSCDK
jgi:hypothetical protein